MSDYCVHENFDPIEHEYCPDCGCEDMIEIEVDQLRYEITRLREAQRWISVDERLPEVDTETLVYRGQAGFCWGRRHPTTGLWYVRYGNHVVLVHDVSHWRPLPEPPEVRE